MIRLRVRSTGINGSPVKNWRSSIFSRCSPIPTELGPFLYILLILSFPRHTWSQGGVQRIGQSSTCHPVDYRVLRPDLITIRCSETNVSSVEVSRGAVYKVETTTITKVSDIGSAKPVVNDHEWLSIALPLSLNPNQKYRLVLSPKTSDAAPSANSFSYDFDTNETISLAQSNVLSHPNQYELSSKLAYKGKQLPTVAEMCIFRFEDYSGKQSSAKAMCTYENNVTPGMGIDLAESLAREGLAQVGLVTVDFSGSLLVNSFLHQLPLGIDGLTDIFDHSLKLDPKSKFVAQKAPATKDASHYYVNVSYGAGVGSKPAWIIDAKLAPPVGSLVKGFQFSPLAAADIGHNTVSGMTYTDTIDFGATAARVFPIASPLQEILLTPGFAYETDRELDRHNLLSTLDVRYNFAHLYNPQSTRSLQEYEKQLKRMKNSAVDATDAGPTKITLQPEDIKPPLFGYALDLHTGIEAGGALVNTTVKATSGSATEVLPTYSIMRFVPQIHGLLQVWRFSIDSTAAVRYLAVSENTVVQLANKSLKLERLSGWKAYGVITGGWSLDDAGHFAITVAFKDGFAPPKFQRVNTVLAGLMLKY
jgi:hypothetical protein